MRTGLAAIGATALALAAPAEAQQSIAADSALQSPLPYFKDLGKWDPNYKPPRTASGTPDLQGVWSTAALTKMTRGGRDGAAGIDTLAIPQEKIDELNSQNLRNVNARRESLRTDPASGAPTDGDVKGYNGFWLDPGTEYAKVNGEWRSSLIVSPANGQIPYTSVGRSVRGQRMLQAKTIRNTGPEIRTLGDRCLISFGSHAGPPLNNALYNNHIQIIQTPDHLMLNVEMNHDARIIRVEKLGEKDGHLPAGLKKWFGDSIGRWEGDTFVVETTDVHPLQGRAGAAPLSEGGKVVERFTRVSDKEIFYEFTVEDPLYYSEPWKGEIPLRLSTERIFEYACHEGNYALPGILVGDALGHDTAINQDGE